jgi:hypothetical protein
MMDIMVRATAMGLALLAGNAPQPQPDQSEYTNLGENAGAS